MELAIRVKEVKKTFHVGIQDIEVLKGITFNVEKGDFVIIIGPSGCGKSTLLHTILGLEGPSSGIVEILGENLYDNHDEDYRSEFRKKHIGMIYQQPNWIKSLTVVENVSFPLSLLGVRKDLALVKAWEALAQIGMKNWSNHGPTELSSGQQQKVALARALITDAQIIVADEPTGNLDYTSGQDLMNLMVELNKKGKTIVMVTHDLEYLKYSKTAVRMLDGKVEGIYRGEEKAVLESNVKLKRVENEDAKVSIGDAPIDSADFKQDKESITESKNDEKMTEEAKPPVMPEEKPSEETLTKVDNIIVAKKEKK